MDIHIKGTGVVLTAELRTYFDKHAHKVRKLVKAKDARLDVEFEALTERTTADAFRVECMVRGSGLDVRAEARAGTLHAAIDETIDTLSVELRKIKGKRLKLFRTEGLTWKNWIRFGRNKNL